MDLIDLDVGKLVNKKWVIESKLGEGACGVVYKVHDVDNMKLKAALKVEATNDEMGVLKKEANVIKQLQLRKHVVRLIYCGKREQYSYIVMTLYGKNLSQLKKDANLDRYTPGTVARVGIQALYAIKQLHEVGYVHRDVKPSNMVIGRHRMEKKMVFLIDFGMCRSYAVWDNGMARVRKQREKALLRGTQRYCSPTVHKRLEQGRKDDIWSLCYVMVELADRLPWTGKKEKETGIMKDSMKDEELLKNCPQQWLGLMNHVRSLQYEDRPNYRLMYDILLETMNHYKAKFLDPYDWENEPDEGASAMSMAKKLLKPGETKIVFPVVKEEAKVGTPAIKVEPKPAAKEEHKSPVVKRESKNAVPPPKAEPKATAPKVEQKGGAPVAKVEPKKIVNPEKAPKVKEVKAEKGEKTPIKVEEKLVVPKDTKVPPKDVPKPEKPQISVELPTPIKKDQPQSQSPPQVQPQPLLPVQPLPISVPILPETIESKPSVTNSVDKSKSAKDSSSATQDKEDPNKLYPIPTVDPHEFDTNDIHI